MIVLRRTPKSTGKQITRFKLNLILEILQNTDEQFQFSFLSYDSDDHFTSEHKTLRDYFK
jgi:hypothetical protein